MSRAPKPPLLHRLQQGRTPPKLFHCCAGAWRVEGTEPYSTKGITGGLGCSYIAIAAHDPCQPLRAKCVNQQPRTPIKSELSRLDTPR